MGDGRDNEELYNLCATHQTLLEPSDQGVCAMDSACSTHEGHDALAYSIHLVQERSQWRVVMNTAVNCRIK
jgi:hypothetical protein